jgi:hypothetical protein
MPEEVGAMQGTIFSKADYWHWLETLRFGRQALQEAKDSEEAHVVAVNIGIAYAHLSEDEESPFKDRLDPADLATVALARGTQAS